MGNVVDRTGQKFWKLTVLRLDHMDISAFWRCLCDCGNETVVASGQLVSGRKKSCGCLVGQNFIDLKGQKFGRLTVIERKLPNSKYGHPRWLCKCSCGATTTVLGTCLKRGVTKSCGCLQIETMTSHGMSNTPTYTAWEHMKARCNNPKTRYFNNYGGRGIKVCDRWMDSFENFLEDMGTVSKGLTLERIDNAGNYEPKNCKWATWREQSRNRRSNRMIEYRGKTKCLQDWAKQRGEPHQTLQWRLNKGYSPEKAFNMGERDHETLSLLSKTAGS